MIAVGKFNDLTGQKFGRLTVIRRTEDVVTEKGNKFTQWFCVCDCGFVIVAMNALF